MDLGIAGKLALVTASSGGIGLEIARSLAREGARVVINGRSSKTVNGAIETIRSTEPDADLIPLVADNGTAEGCSQTIKEVPSVDILVNNLGTYEAVNFFEETDEAWERLFRVNILSGVRLTRHYLKQMLEKNEGRVVFISSESGLAPDPEMTNYSSTKATQLAISRSLAQMTQGTKVTVNAVLPGPTHTVGVEHLIADKYPGKSIDEAGSEFVKEARSNSLIQRLIEPEEIGDTVAFVVSQKAGAINGAAVRAEGGVVRFIA